MMEGNLTNHDLSSHFLTLPCLSLKCHTHFYGTTEEEKKQAYRNTTFEAFLSVWEKAPKTDKDCRAHPSAFILLLFPHQNGQNLPLQKPTHQTFCQDTSAKAHLLFFLSLRKKNE